MDCGPLTADIIGPPRMAAVFMPRLDRSGSLALRSSEGGADVQHDTRHRRSGDAASRSDPSSGTAMIALFLCGWTRHPRSYARRADETHALRLERLTARPDR